MHFSDDQRAALHSLGVLPYTSEAALALYKLRQGSDEWFQERQLRITATDAPLALRQSIYGGPEELIRRKFCATDQTESMKSGTEQGPLISAAYQRQMLVRVMTYLGGTL
jgi:hypothetical protein